MHLKFFRSKKKENKLKKENEILAKIDKMRIKIQVYTLIKGLGLTTKKIVESINMNKRKNNTIKFKYQKTEICLLNLANAILDKEKNIL